jgi:ribosomal protein S24E
MKVNIISKKQNPLLKRKEVTFSVDHTQNGGTPSRADVSRQLALVLKTKLELIFIKKMKTKTGTTIAIGEVNVYDKLEQAKLIEPNHIISRNSFLEKIESKVPEELTEERERKK